MAIMKIGVIGLGKMGKAIVYRLRRAGFAVIGFDKRLKAETSVTKYGATIASSIEKIPQQADVVWLMVPAGKTVDLVLMELKLYLKKDHIVIDGGNSYFKDSINRAQQLKKNGIHFIDCGTSGGLAGKKKGFSLMVGGNEKIFNYLEPVFKALAAPKGYGYMGKSGSGHYVKMVHNGIEYALLQAYAEGFHVLKNGSYKNLDLEKITSVWEHGSIIRSWILHLAHDVFKHDQELKDITGAIQESGMGQWTVDEAREKNIPVTLIDDALKIRAWSRQTGGDYSTKLVALLRHAFGGHAVTKRKKK